MMAKSVLKKLNTMVLVMLLLCMEIPCQAQKKAISMETNCPQTDKTVSKQFTAYAYEGQGGENQVWDFCNMDSVGSYNITYEYQGDILRGVDREKAYYYCLEDDGLWLTGYENSQGKMDYSAYKPALFLPLTYGEIRSCNYEGNGKYCGTHYMREYGTYQQKADGYGLLILSEGDTLYNVLRIQTINTSALRISQDSLENDNDNQKQIVTESYQWFVPGYRYPVFETVSCTTYHDLKPVATRQYALRCLHEKRAFVNDSINIKFQKEQSTQQTDIFSYEISNIQNRATITYTLKADATLRVIVADVKGVLHRCLEQTHPSGQGYELTIDCNGLRHGQYIVYMNVNGTVYNHMINVK